jgi:hypothetical protein
MTEPSNSTEESNHLTSESGQLKDDKSRPWLHRDFWLGVILFFTLNGIFYLISNLVSFDLSYVGIAAFLVNAAILVLTSRERPKFASGMLFSLGSLFLLGLCAGIFLIATCFSRI